MKPRIEFNYPWKDEMKESLPEMCECGKAFKDEKHDCEYANKRASEKLFTEMKRKRFKDNNADRFADALAAKIEEEFEK